MAIQKSDPANSSPNHDLSIAPTDNGDLHELLRMEDVGHR